MKSCFFVLPFLALLLTPTTIQAAYEHEQVIQYPNTNAVRKAVKDLDLDVWNEDAQAIEIRVNPNQRRLLGQRLGPHALSTKTVVSNLEELVKAEAEAISLAPNEVTTGPEFHSNFHSLADITSWLKLMQEKYPQVLTYVESIGSTFEQRPIPMVKLNGAGSVNGQDSAKKTVWFQAMQHAREWIAGSSALYIIDQLASGYGTDETITKLLNTVQIIIIPVSNPDGYNYSFSNPSNRYWRKSRGETYGVDLNRNWPDHWVGEGSSTNPRSDTYRGQAPGSTDEVKALIATYQSFPQIIAALDLHTYGNLILRPFGWTDNSSEDEVALNASGEFIKAAVAKVNGASYVNEHAMDLYQVNGGSIDWFYGAGTPVGKQKPYSFTFELTTGGFSRPPSDIVPIGKEALSAFIAMSQYAVDHPLPVKTAESNSNKSL